jgi:8-oxo-dGTP pyrophosphatase MutT (NUDIX family)
VHGIEVHAIILTVNDVFRMERDRVGAQCLPADWAQRLQDCVLPAPAHLAPPSDVETDPARVAVARANAGGAWRPAAVLVPIIQRGALGTVLLTRRHEQLRQHAGQISFPGGALDSQSEDIVAAALRETAEETGIEAGFVRPLGFLPDHHVRTGYRITPVVALLEPGFVLRPQAAEVAEIFELPLSLALDAQRYVPVVRRLNEVEFTSLDLHYGQHQIWGATASVLRSLCTLFHAALTR